MSRKKRKTREKTSAEVFVAGKMAKLPADDEEFTIETRDALPAHLLIKIESFSLLSERGIDKYESREFEAGDYKFKILGMLIGYYWIWKYTIVRLIIHPNGLMESENDEDEHISAYVAIVKSSSMPANWEVNGIFSIFLYNQVLDKYLCFQSKMRRFHAMKTQWGFSKLISIENLKAPGNGFLVDDNCVFGAEVSVVNKSEQFTECLSVREIDNPHKREWTISSFSKLENVWCSGEFTAGDHKWKIQLYPNGNAKEEGQSVSIFLYLVGLESLASHEKVKADYHLCIKNQLNDQHHSLDASDWFTSPLYAWGLLGDGMHSYRFLICVIPREASSLKTAAS